MDKKQILVNYIRESVRTTLREQAEQIKKNERAIYLIHRFPGLHKVMSDLMSPSYARWISHVGIVAPKPTTLKVDLINGQEFFLIFNGRGVWSAKVAGKLYYIMSLPELQRASKAISNLLILNYEPQLSEEDTKKKKDKDLADDINSSGGGGFDNFSDIDIDNLDDDLATDDIPEDGNAPESDDVNDDEIDVDLS